MITVNNADLTIFTQTVWQGDAVKFPQKDQLGIKGNAMNFVLN